MSFFSLCQELGIILLFAITDVYPHAYNMQSTQHALFRPQQSRQPQNPPYWSSLIRTTVSHKIRIHCILRLATTKYASWWQSSYDRSVPQLVCPKGKSEVSWQCLLSCRCDDAIPVHHTPGVSLRCLTQRKWCARTDVYETSVPIRCRVILCVWHTSNNESTRWIKIYSNMYVKHSFCVYVSQILYCKRKLGRIQTYLEIVYKWKDLTYHTIYSQVVLWAFWNYLLCQSIIHIESNTKCEEAWEKHTTRTVCHTSLYSNYTQRDLNGVTFELCPRSCRVNKG